jgi:hypothetical protein
LIFNLFIFSHFILDDIDYNKNHRKTHKYIQQEQQRIQKFKSEQNKPKNKMIDRIVEAASITHSTVTNNNSPYVILIDEESSNEEDPEIRNEQNERDDVESDDAKSSADDRSSNPNNTFILNRSESFFKYSSSYIVSFSISCSLGFILFGNSLL